MQEEADRVARIRVRSDLFLSFDGHFLVLGFEDYVAEIFSDSKRSVIPRRQHRPIQQLQIAEHIALM